jgi:hypothetical protein
MNNFKTLFIYVVKELGVSHQVIPEEYGEAEARK